MKIVKTISEVRAAVKAWRAEGLSVGLVPTMGFLHEGHKSLIDRAVVSDFVNPTQFGPTEDLASYPRDLQRDAALCENAGAALLFNPEPSEMYAEDACTFVDMSGLTGELCGKSRPIHFRGVCTVVSKLFHIVAPDRAYFGEKDFQQIAVIRAMVEDLHLKVEIVPCPVVREKSGLAMSSRNTLLTDGEKAVASHIFGILSKSKNFATNHTLKETRQYVVDSLNAIVGLEVQYFAIVDGGSLQELDSWSDSDDIVGCITVFCGSQPIRLIDHVRYKE